MATKITIIFLIILYATSKILNKENKSNNDNLRAIKVSRLFPVVGNDGKLKVYEPHNIEIYYFGDQVLYKTPYIFYTALSNGDIVQKDKRTHYLVFTKGNIYGHFTDSSMSFYDKKILVDSALNNQWYMTGFLSSLFAKINILLVSSNKNENLGNLEKIYTFKGKVDTTQTGSIFLSFTNSLKDIDYSLSEELDSIEKMKLYKIKIVNNSRYLKDYNITVDEVEQNREITPIPITNRTEILKFFERDKKYNIEQ